jgi:hypothetical protein
MLYPENYPREVQLAVSSTEAGDINLHIQFAQRRYARDRGPGS